MGFKRTVNDCIQSVSNNLEIKDILYKIIILLACPIDSSTFLLQALLKLILSYLKFVTTTRGTRLFVLTKLM